MSKWRFLPFFLAVALLRLPVCAQEAHLTEAGSAPILSRSAFAHGYRHGYEEGYHLGNLDVNLARPPRTKKPAGRETTFGYSPRFGSRESFVDGFQAGLQAGYFDGYSGLEFRVVNATRTLAAHLNDGSRVDTTGGFDQGLGAGYRDGFAQGERTPKIPAGLDFESVICAPAYASQDGGFCDGYRRGFALGRVDALTLHQEYILEASK